jgi:hypothetical protein
MKKALIALWILASSTVVYAACSTHTYTQNGRMVTCTTCCYGNNCNTNCY